jgi:hypothetical protein
VSFGRSLATALPWVATGVVLAGAAHQAAVAFGWLSIGPLPGQQASGQPFVFGSALVALVLLGAALPASAAAGLRVAATPCIAVAAALLVVARFYSFDPYYAPYLRRMSDGGLLPGRWIVFVVACALAASLLAARATRSGQVAVALVCWLAFGTAFVSGLGH